ncbi:MAG: saccharopine dehydrogenase C-terminal domain-containing protein [Chloroflexota bacterium]|nr:saccharopine dehydrogenase NADP-binding domain-containing protein [Anaerolineales bacterium]
MSETPHYHYLILGAGRQGTAAAYDLAKFGAASKVTLADMYEETAVAAANRVNELIGWDVAVGKAINVADAQSVMAFMLDADAALSAVPYYFNLDITKAAIATQTHLCDMGGHTGIVRQQLVLDKEAQAAGVSIVPDCGMGPGLINTMAAYAIDLLDETHAIHIYDGGLPQHPKPPWNYQLTFHVNGLTNEMDGKAVFIRDGEVAYVDTLTEPEFIEFAPLGMLEADITSGGTSTAPWTFKGRVKAYENKTLRYPGHFEWLRAFKQLGLFSEEPVQVNGQSVVPRQLYHTLLEPQISAPDVRDVCAVRIVGEGVKDGRETAVTIDLLDYFDEATGFTAMERLTGWHCAIMMGFQARGIVRAGGIPMETAVTPADFMAELPKRGIDYQVYWK